MDEKTIHVFHYKNEGWLWINQFIDLFTKLKSTRNLFKVLEFRDYSLPFEHTNRELEPNLFSELDKSVS